MTFSFEKNKNKLLFLPLGGSGEIGMNLNLYHYQGKWIMVDCGSSFGEERIMPGLDIIVPDVSFLLENKISIDGLIVTHCHEDHIGAIPYLWPALKMPIYATTFTANLIRAKLMEFDFYKEVKIIEMTPNKNKFNIGQFEVETVGLTHSVPEMKALLISTPMGKIFHTGDWKLDSDPVVGSPSDEKRMKEIGEEGVLAMVCDSTNIFNKEWSKSESSVTQNLHDIIKKQKQMVTVTTFASNIARIETISRIAQECGRDVYISGSSMHRVIAAAKKSGYLQDFEYLDIKEINEAPRSKTLLLATGCQGEPLATVTKMSSNSHPFVKLKSGDTVIFSSRIIPGNEESIFATFNRLVDLGVNLINEHNALVHVSGHPSKPEVGAMYSFIKPTIAIPVHGQSMHLQEHCNFAKQECGIKYAISVRNGNVISLEESGPSIIHKAKIDYLGVDGCILQPPGGEVMRMRRRLTQNGIVICNLVVNKQGKIVCHPQISSPGSIDSNHSDIIADLTRMATETVNQHGPSLFGDKNNSGKEAIHKLKERIKSSLKRSIIYHTELQPIIEVLIQVV